MMDYRKIEKKRREKLNFLERKNGSLIFVVLVKYA